MLYVIYHELYKKFKKAENSYYSALDKKSKLLYSVEPHSSKPKAILPAKTTKDYDEHFINYTSYIKEVDDLINETRNTKEVLEYELKKKEVELRNSKDTYDMIYVLKWIEHTKAKDICRVINYSKRQTERKIKEIENVIYPGLKERREKLEKIISEKRRKEKEKFNKIFKK